MAPDDSGSVRARDCASGLKARPGLGVCDRASHSLPPFQGTEARGRTGAGTVHRSWRSPVSRTREGREPPLDEMSRPWPRSSCCFRL